MWLRTAHVEEGAVDEIGDQMEYAHATLARALSERIQFIRFVHRHAARTQCFAGANVFLLILFIGSLGDDSRNRCVRAVASLGSQMIRKSAHMGRYAVEFGRKHQPECTRTTIMS